jgi:cytoskeletal protein RodZ
VSKELLPGTYTFRMEYVDGRVDKQQNISENAEVVFNTINTKIALKDSNGNGLEGGLVKYSRSSWTTVGNTAENGEVSKELLPGTYTFRMEYMDGRVDKQQNISENAEVIFNTVLTRVIVKNSNGQLMGNALVKYSRTYWSNIAFTAQNGEVTKELLPNTYVFRAEYSNVRKDKQQNISENNIVEVVIDAVVTTPSVTTTPPVTTTKVTTTTATTTAVSNTTTEPVQTTSPPTTTTETTTSQSNNVIVVSNVNELRATENLTKQGNVTVLIKDGVYDLTKGLWLTGENITYKSMSGDRDAVILKGNFQASHIFWITNDNVTIQDVTIGEVNNHGIQVHSEMGASNVTIKNVRFYNIKEQMIKGSGSQSEVYSENCIVEDCLFEFTSGDTI